MESNYPGYEIEGFENEGGCCGETCTVCQSIVEVDDGTSDNQQMPGTTEKDPDSARN